MHPLTEFFKNNEHLSYKFPKINPGPNRIHDITAGVNKIPFVRLNTAGPWAEMLAEIKQIDDLFVPHRDDGHTQGWSSLCLHGLGAFKTDAPSVYEEYKDIPDDQLPYNWTEIAERCPTAYNFFKNVFPYESYMRLRFMRLAPGGFIGTHTDATSFALSAVNISLNNPDGCAMVLENIGVVPFDPNGGALAFCTSFPHAVWNRSSEPRYHMIVHGRPAYKYHVMLERSYDLEYQRNPDDSNV